MKGRGEGEETEREFLGVLRTQRDGESLKNKERGGGRKPPPALTGGACGAGQPGVRRRGQALRNGT